MDPLLPNMVAQAQIDYVGQIAEMCRHHGTECVYAYGPIYDGYCTQAGDYVAKVESGVAATGLPIVAGTPLCIPEIELGDTVDHVRPDLKDTYTRRYFECCDRTSIVRERSFEPRNEVETRRAAPRGAPRRHR